MEEDSKMPRLTGLFMICILLVSWAVVANASTWGGHNGDIRLTFTEGPEYEHVKQSEPMPKAGVIIDLYAVLSGVERVTYVGQQYLSVGGWELQLRVDGAEWEIMEIELPEQSINAGREKGCMYVGKYTGVKFVDGDAKLARWRIRLLGEPKNVTFSLDPAGLNSCAAMEGCPDSGTQALWTGSGAAGQVGLLFSAGYIPAYLNWEGETPELKPVRGKGDWRDTGLFTLDE